MARISPSHITAEDPPASPAISLKQSGTNSTNRSIRSTSGPETRAVALELPCRASHGFVGCAGCPLKHSGVAKLWRPTPIVCTSLYANPGINVPIDDQVGTFAEQYRPRSAIVVCIWKTIIVQMYQRPGVALDQASRALPSDGTRGPPNRCRASPHRGLSLRRAVRPAGQQ